MNRGRLAAVAFAVAVGLTAAAGLFGATGLAPGDTGPTHPAAGTPTDTPDDRKTPDAEAVAEGTRLLPADGSLSLPAAEDATLEGTTPLAPGADLTVSVRSSDGARPFARSVGTTVADDGTFRAAVDLSAAAPGSTVRVLVLRDGRELVNRTAAIAASGDTPDGDASATIHHDGDAVTLESAAGQVVRGSTDLAPGTEVTVRLRSSGGDQPFVRQTPATVGPDGRFEAEFDLSSIEAGTSFTVTVAVDGDTLASAPGEVVDDD